MTTDTSREAVLNLAIRFDSYLLEDAAATLRALLAERDAAVALAKRHMDQRHKTQREACQDWDLLQSRVAEVLAQRDAALADAARLREALQWMVDNDETNEGDEPDPDLGGRSWNEINAYWIDGLNRARAALAGGKHE